eukprot:5159-Heterococcus_DN1.PRE.4
MIVQAELSSALKWVAKKSHSLQERKQQSNVYSSSKRKYMSVMKKSDHENSILNNKSLHMCDYK